MRLTDLLDRENAFRYMLGFVLAVIFLVIVAAPARSLAGFYDHLDLLSDSVRRGDFGQAAGQVVLSHQGIDDSGPRPGRRHQHR